MFFKRSVSFRTTCQICWSGIDPKSCRRWSIVLDVTWFQVRKQGHFPQTHTFEMRRQTIPHRSITVLRFTTATLVLLHLVDGVKWPQVTGRTSTLLPVNLQRSSGSTWRVKTIICFSVFNVRPAEKEAVWVTQLWGLKIRYQTSRDRRSSSAETHKRNTKRLY